MNTEVSRRAVTQNLVDAGCEEPLIDAFWQLFRSGKEKEIRALLEKHRRYLLDRCHTEQKKIDCLDYLIYQLEQNESG